MNLICLTATYIIHSSGLRYSRMVASFVRTVLGHDFYVVDMVGCQVQYIMEKN